MKMRKSKVLQKIRAGKVVSCFKTNFSDARSVEIAALSGFDCIWADMEHIPNDWSVLEKQIWAAKSQNVDVLVRVSRGGYNDYIKPLELDAAGIMVPHIMSLEDAKNVVKMTRFHLTGLRPVNGGNADGSYCNIDLLSYFKQANEQRFLILQIEDQEPLEYLEAIANLDGIDMLFFGAADFSQSIGAPGQLEHPKIIDTKKHIVEAAAAHGKFAGIPSSLDTLYELVELGYKFIIIGANVLGIIDYCKKIISRFSLLKITKSFS